MVHDTVGITYQKVDTQISCATIDVNGSATTDQNNNTSQTHGRKQPKEKTRKRRRRAYESNDSDIAPYKKKPRMLKVAFLKSKDDRRKPYEIDTKVFESVWYADVSWMINVALTKDTPMWAGWNAHRTSKREDTQKIWYLPQINASPTSCSVVQETMKKSQDIAKEAQRNSICVTYDLAIAKLAMQIQSEETPRFDYVFVALGSFHIELAFFSALGKLIADSGGPHILNETGVLANGSLKSFLRGKSYKRCKRLHELLALAMETLHFKSFLKSTDGSSDEMMESILKIKNIDDITSEETGQSSADLKSSLATYKQYVEETKQGQHGKTAQFWINYAYIMHLYHVFTRSARCGDFELFITCIPKLINVFFAFNHQNYARWLLKYYHNLLKLPETHPEVYEDFKRGQFSIRRTTKPFSGSPIDLTLEQTINADAASQRTGISALTNSISARQRWAESHYLRTMLLTVTFEQLGMTRKEDISAHLKPHQIKSDNQDLQKIVEMVVETMDPFDQNIEKDCLFNIVTGKQTSEDAAKFLLSMEEIGNQAKHLFDVECQEDEERFERAIKKQKVHTFATDIKKTKLKSKDGKLVAACMMRDLFGCILKLSLEKKIDMAEVLKFPLTPVPLSLSHVDGTMQKTQKATLLKHLESLSRQDRLILPLWMRCSSYIYKAIIYHRLLEVLPEAYYQSLYLWKEKRSILCLINGSIHQLRIANETTDRLKESNFTFKGRNKNVPPIGSQR